MMEPVVSKIPSNFSTNLKFRNIKSLEEYIKSNIHYITHACYINAISIATSVECLDETTLTQTQPFNSVSYALWRHKLLENRDNMCFYCDNGAHFNIVKDRTY